jgi:soluble lytic murein transglycosylase
MGSARGTGLWAALMVGALASGSGCRPAAAPRVPPPPPEAPAEAPAEAAVTAELDPASLLPAPGARLARVLIALREARPGDALALLDESAEADPMLRAWLRSRALAALDRPVEAHEALAPVASSDHPLAPWARLRRAMMQRPVNPAGAADELADVTEADFAGRARARAVRAAALLESEQAEVAEPLLRAQLARAGPESAAASVAMPLARMLAARDDPASRREAIALYRRVDAFAPASTAAAEAREALTPLLADLPPAEREAPVLRRIQRAEALASLQRHRAAAEAFRDAAVDAERDEDRCRALYGEGRAVYHQRQRRRAAELLEAAARGACRQDPDRRAWALFYAARGRTSAGSGDAAIALYGELEAAHPGHRLADDARYRAALLREDGGELEAARAMLEALPADYPQGDMGGHARFRVAWQARQTGDRATAFTHLDALMNREDEDEAREDLHGRAAYWRAVVLEEQGQREAARRGFMDLVEARPLSYYAQQAIARLDERSPEDGAAARALLGPRRAAPLTFPWRDAFDAPALTRAAALLSVGETAWAARELDAWSGADADLGWIEAALFVHAGDYPRAVHATRRRLTAFRREPPTGRALTKWRIAYPQAFAPLIDQVAEEREIPPGLVRAIAREESSFRPEAVSAAHAYGLTQLILPTARRFARRVGLRATRRTLREPEVNVRIGASFMRWLWERYESNPAVLPSAYNAGQGATDRWIRERSGQRLDEWIEEIPYDETRRYTRRVLQSWGVYAWLYEGELPTLRGALPTR